MDLGSWTGVIARPVMYGTVRERDGGLTHRPGNRGPPNSIGHDEDKEERDADPSLSGVGTPVRGVLRYVASVQEYDLKPFWRGRRA